VFTYTRPLKQNSLNNAFNVIEQLPYYISAFSIYADMQCYGVRIALKRHNMYHTLISQTCCTGIQHWRI